MRGLHSTSTIIIKIRILDYIGRIKAGVSNIRHVFSFCTKFGYDKNDIEVALNELMQRSRALLWSADHWTVKSHDSFAEIMITPIGLNYYENLFGELFYVEVCLAENVHDKVPVQQVTEFDREFMEQDIKEVKKFVDEYGTDQYVKNYSDINCLSLKHAKKLKKPINRIRERYEGIIEFDEKREEYINKTLNDILNPIQSN